MTEVIQATPLSQLSEAGMCKTSRMVEKKLGSLLVRGETNSPNFFRAYICRDIIQQALRHKVRKGKDIMEYMNGRYVEAGFINPQQKNQVLLDDWKYIMRYIYDETREPRFVKTGYPVLKDGELPVKVQPTVLFPVGDKVDIVIIKIGRPNISRRGEKGKMARDLQLYAMVKYARMLGYKNINDIAVLAYSKNELLSVADKLTELGVPSKFGAPEKLVDNNRVQALLKFSHLIYKDVDTFSDDTLIVANALFDGNLIEEDSDVIVEKLSEVMDTVKEIRSSYEDEKKKLFLGMLRSLAHGDEAVLNFEEKFKDMEFEEILKYCDDFEIFGADMQYKRSELGDGVMLITAHSSKGLEWKYVFGSVTGFQKPGNRISSRKVEEMRRLLFVLITRARDVLKLYGVYTVSGNTIETRVYNMFLKECYEALDKTFAPVFTK